MARLTIDIRKFDLDNVIELNKLNREPNPNWLKALKNRQTIKLSNTENIKAFINSVSDLSILFDTGTDNIKSRLIHAGALSNLIEAATDIKNILVVYEEDLDEEKEAFIYITYSQSILDHVEAESIISDWNYSFIKILTPFMTTNNIARYNSNSFHFVIEAKENFLLMDVEPF